MNLSVQDRGGELLMISQFTLIANCKKGTRPSFTGAMPPTKAEDFYNTFLSELRSACQLNVQDGKFGADMKVSLVNEGPVTIWIDSKNRE